MIIDKYVSICIVCNLQQFLLSERISGQLEHRAQHYNKRYYAQGNIDDDFFKEKRERSLSPCVLRFQDVCLTSSSRLFLY